MSAADELAWQGSALCAQTLPDIFFPEDGGGSTVRQAKAICAMCGVRSECFEWTVANPDLTAFGIWAGMTELERRQLKRRVA